VVKANRIKHLRTSCPGYSQAFEQNLWTCQAHPAPIDDSKTPHVRVRDASCTATRKGRCINDLAVLPQAFPQASQQNLWIVRIGQDKISLGGVLTPDGHAFGRPAGVALDARGALLVADDVGNAVWRVAPTTGAAGAK
jgi:hypothetical protein